MIRATKTIRRFVNAFLISDEAAMKAIWLEAAERPKPIWSTRSRQAPTSGSEAPRGEHGGGANRSLPFFCCHPRGGADRLPPFFCRQTGRVPPPLSWPYRAG